MRAANLTISIPYNGCDKNCDYCVSKMTGSIETNTDLMLRNINKVKTLARAAQITNVLFTGKGEPCLNWEELVDYIKEFKDFPCELQTNGIILNNNINLVDTLQFYGLDVVALSIDKLEQFSEYSKLFKRIQDVGMTSRVTLNITNMIPEITTFRDVVVQCIAHGVDQLLLRNIVIPNNVPKSKYTKWIRDNTNPSQYDTMVDEMREELAKNGKFLRSTEFGMLIYDYMGISVTTSDYCIQDNSKNIDIRSLIYLDDGHLYTSWNSKASRLF